jgi:hypothetical protein
MEATTTCKLRRVTLASETLIGICVVLVLMLFGVARHPASASHGGLTSLLSTAGALLVYGAAAFWVRVQFSDSWHIALGKGAMVGLLLAAVAVISHTLEIFANLNSSWSATFGVGMWGLMFLLFGIVGSSTYDLTSSLRMSIAASIWCALISTVATLVYGYTIALLFMPHMQNVLQGAQAQSGITDSQAFVIFNTLVSGSAHVLLAPLVALIFGFTGGCARSILRPVPRNIAAVLLVFELLLAVAGLFAIRFASSLNRPERPPYIMFGLLALGVTMASAHPVITAIRQSGSKQATTST